MDCVCDANICGGVKGMVAHDDLEIGRVHCVGSMKGGGGDKMRSEVEKRFEIEPGLLRRGRKKKGEKGRERDGRGWQQTGVFLTLQSSNYGIRIL